MKKRKGNRDANAKKKKVRISTGLEEDELFLEEDLADKRDGSDEEKTLIEDKNIAKEDNETVEEKRLRLAKAHIEKMGMAASQDADDDEEGAESQDVVNKRLQMDVLKSRGQFRQPVADQLMSGSAPTIVRTLKGHRLPVTCVTSTSDGLTAYSGAKDCCIIKWDLETGKRTVIKGGKDKPEYKGHTHQVLSIAVSHDGAILASGGRDKVLRVWDTRTNTQITSLAGHNGDITSIAFAGDSRELFSCSTDRLVKIWNLEEMAFVETLYGHQADVLAIDSVIKDRAVTCGVDRTVRVWRVMDQAQLLFQGGHTGPGSVDCVKALTPDNWVTGGQDGKIAVWASNKRQPVSLVTEAHQGQWITSLGASSYTDLLCSGSFDGHLRFWKCDISHAKNKQQGPSSLKISGIDRTVKINGFINGLNFVHNQKKTTTPTAILAAVGQEHRLGRWYRDGAAKNVIEVISLSKYNESKENGK